MPKRFKIIKASDRSLWYKDYIGWEFVVVKQSDKYVWTREPDEYNLMNFVLVEDIEFI